MTATTAARMRSWTGPAILDRRVRPFFLGAALCAALSMALWVPMLAGRLAVAASADLPPPAVAAVDLAFPLALAAAPGARDPGGAQPAQPGRAFDAGPDHASGRA